MRIVVPLALLGVLGAGATAAWLMKPPPQATPAPAAKVVNVEVLRITPLPELDDSFMLTAIAEPRRVVSVAAEVSGRIESWGKRSQALAKPDPGADAVIQEGEPILAGEPIAHVNKDLLQARYDQAEAQFDYDAREFKRVEGLYEGGRISTTELDNARSRRDISKALLDEAARSLERATIVAPISGVLNDMLIEVGEYVTPGAPVAEIVDVDAIKVVIDVSERDIGYLRLGRSAVVAFGVGEDVTERRGEITYIGEVADPKTRTTRVEVLVDNTDRALRSGQIVSVRLSRRTLHDAVMIPLNSVIPLEKGYVVYVAVDGVAQRRDVELGFIKGPEIRALSGLNEGDLLIVVGHRLVGPGQPVSIVNQ